MSGSPRKNSNTDYLLDVVRSVTGGEFVKLSEYNIEFCRSCRACLKAGECKIDDDMKNEIMPMLIESDAIVLGSPVHFNNVSGHMKAFMDRTWCMRGKLRNKIGGAVVVGRRYGLESAITAINAFFLKHNMIVANRGVCGLAFKGGEIKEDREAINSAIELGERIIELIKLLRH